MNEIADYAFSKAPILDRDEPAKRKAEELRARGCVTGVICCLNCLRLSNWFFDESEASATPRDWSLAMCPVCGYAGGIFLHDTECLDCSKSERIGGLRASQCIADESIHL